MTEMKLPVIDSFEALKSQLAGEGLPFREVDGEQALSLPTRLGDVDSVLHLRWEPTPGVVQFIQPLPLTIPPATRGEVGQALHRINLKLAIQGFTFDEEDGNVAFRTQIVLAADQGVVPGLIGLMIRSSIETASTHLPGIRAIAGS
ncbi:MAG: YbjN domain-containing protein [Geminicoccaceae bacterium]